MYMYMYLSSLDDDSVGRQVDSPGQRGGRDQHLDVLVCKQLLHKSAVHSVHTRVVDGKPVGHQVLQLRVLDTCVQVGEVKHRVP